MLEEHRDEEMGIPPDVATEAASSNCWFWKRGGRVPGRNNPYPMRKDPQEGERLNFQHRLLHKGIGAQFLAPVNNPLTILDAAGGTGIWAREVARERKHAQVETFDKDTLPLEQASARIADMPSNCHHYPQSVDALQRWPYADASFDLVHGRYLASFVPHARWPHIASEALRVCRPGGWVELVEGPIAICEAPTFQELIGAAVRLIGPTLGDGDLSEEIPAALQGAGAINIQLQPFLLGAGSTRVLQPAVAEDLYRVFQSMGPRLLKANALEEERYRACMATVKQDMVSAGVVLPVYVVYGQKPS